VTPKGSYGKHSPKCLVEPLNHQLATGHTSLVAGKVEVIEKLLSVLFGIPSILRLLKYVKVKKIGSLSSHGQTMLATNTPAILQHRLPQRGTHL
jgi:hypothetical protein